MPGSQERERKRARERYERQRQERLERRRRNRQLYSIGIAVLCVVGLAVGLSVAFIGGSPAKKPIAKASSSASASPSASATATTSTAAIAEPAHHCSYSVTSKGSSVPTASPDYKATYTATINTNLGPIKIDLLNSKATCAVNSFVHLASVNFWNNTQCHRVSDSDSLYMLQCGDPTAKAAQKLSCTSTTLGSGTPGYVFQSENLPAGGSSGVATYPAGTLAMANSGTADSNGSQFFLVFKNSSLQPLYPPFGTITSGLDILQKVAKAGTSCTFSGAGGGVPKDKVVIKSVTIKQS